MWLLALLALATHQQVPAVTPPQQSPTVVALQLSTATGSCQPHDKRDSLVPLCQSWCKGGDHCAFCKCASCGSCSRRPCAEGNVTTFEQCAPGCSLRSQCNQCQCKSCQVCTAPACTPHSKTDDHFTSCQPWCNIPFHHCAFCKCTGCAMCSQQKGGQATPSGSSRAVALIVVLALVGVIARHTMQRKAEQGSAGESVSLLLQEDESDESWPASPLGMSDTATPLTGRSKPKHLSELYGVLQARAARSVCQSFIAERVVSWRHRLSGRRRVSCKRNSSSCVQRTQSRPAKCGQGCFYSRLAPHVPHSSRIVPPPRFSQARSLRKMLAEDGSEMSVRSDDVVALNTYREVDRLFLHSCFATLLLCYFATSHIRRLLLKRFAH